MPHALNMNTSVTKRVNGDLIIFLRTILMFLEHHGFNSTIKTFKQECEKLGYKQVTQFTSGLQTDTDIKPKSKVSNVQTKRQMQSNRKKEDGMKIKASKSEFICPKCKHPIELNKNVINESSVEPKKYSEQDKKGKTDALKSKQDLKNSGEDNDDPNELDELKNKLTNLENEHQKLMEITMELTLALQKSIRGQTDNMNSIINNCRKIYPELFYVEPETNLNKTIISNNFTQSTKNDNLQNKPAIEKIDFFSNSSDSKKYSTYFELNYKKIGNELKNGEDKIKLLLLQALRWRLTKSVDSIRMHVIKSFYRHDLLEIRETPSDLLESMYCPAAPPDLVQQAVAQLVNAFASLKLGRDYITHESKLLNLLLPVIMGNHPSKTKLDHFTRDMIVATLQKLSLRYCQRVRMIKSGLVEHMVAFLSENYKTMSTYCLEYTTALMMNLWLHNESREKCRPMALKVIKLLGNLLDVNFNSCLPFVNGSLYNLLSDSYFFQAAKIVGLTQTVKQRIEKTEGEAEEQLNYIVEIMNNPKVWKANCDCNFGLETDAEMDILEPELDEDDLMQSAPISGENLLYEYRLVFSTNESPTSKVDESNEMAQQKPLVEKCPCNFSENPQKTAAKPIITQNEVENEKNSNKEMFLIRELSFCEETQRFYRVPTKESVFENKNSLTVPNMSAAKTSLPVTPNYVAVESKLPTVQEPDAKPRVYSTCYRENYTPVCLCAPLSRGSSPQPNDAEQPKNKYSCQCYDILKNSVDDDNRNDSQEEMRKCKYNIPSNEVQLSARSDAINTERDSGVSSGKLDESDYESVFESRPRILRTP